MDLKALEQPLNAESLQHLLAYLRRNGLTEAEETLAREAANVLKLSKDQIDNTDANNDAVVREFESLLSHVGSSFDSFRSEFSLLIFPVFAHLYIHLVVEGMTSAAALFASKYAKSVPSMYEEPTQTLIRLTTHSQAANHPLVNALTKNPFVLRMSKSATKQLESLLARNLAIKDIIRDHIIIEPLDGARSKVSIEAQMGGIVGQINKQDRKHKVYYGLVREDLSAQFGTDKKRLKGKDRSDSKKKDANGPAPDRIPLPSLYERRSYMVKDSVKKVKVSQESPPCICLYTALNAHGGLTAADISDDSSCLAVGYGNSTVQLFSLDEEKLRPLKKIDQLESLEQESEDILDQLYDDSQASTCVTFQGHSGPVYSVSFSPDKRLLLSSSRDATVRLWSVGTRSNVVVYRQSMPIWQAQFCSRSYYFATAGADGTAMLWATDRLQPLRIFADAFSDVSCIDFHPNCNYIIGGSDDRYVRMWDVLSGACVRTFSGHKGSVRSVKVSPCGRYIASTGAEGSLAVWDIALQRMVCMHEVSPFLFATSLAFSREGSTLAVGRTDSKLSLYCMDSITTHTNNQEQINHEPKIDVLTRCRLTLSAFSRVNPAGFHLFTYATKNTPIIGLHFTRHNLLLAVGGFGQA
uniref:LisH domain-containing protein n=1 Tax=Syphacia muris TaxID=451379 RepID=A0A0N5AUZ1_9BILA